jgi:hypothetical protein
LRRWDKWDIEAASQIEHLVVLEVLWFPNSMGPRWDTKWDSVPGIERIERDSEQRAAALNWLQQAENKGATPKNGHPYHGSALPTELSGQIWLYQAKILSS